MMMFQFQKAQYSLTNTALSQSNQILKQLIQGKEQDETDNNCLTFGIWSKYNPLSNTNLKNSYDLFESNCFQVINAFDYVTQSLIFIYYDCVDPTTKEIKKFIFGYTQNTYFIFKQPIEPSEYENIWYFLQIISFQSEQKLEFSLYYQIDNIFRQTVNMIMPAKDQQILITFGGNLKIDIQDIEEYAKIFAVFPGSIVLQNYEMKRIPAQFNFYDQITQSYKKLKQCICQYDSKIIFDDSHLKQLDQKIYVSKQIYCNSYTLSGWFQIQNLYQQSEEFTYQFLKISTNLDRFQNENLVTFQFFYQISPINNKILITTYKYDFPIVTQDFVNNEFLIKREFIISNNLTCWQFLFLNLDENTLDFQITFHDDQNIQTYQSLIDIKQFHDCQFKITYGNIQQTDLNYIDIIVRNMIFTNCIQYKTLVKCHLSCKECDGPSQYNCLTCSEESNRIYIPEFKRCVCPYSSIDQENECINYRDQRLRLDYKEKRNQKCEQGFFELDGDCFKCPSRIKENLITCSECYLNVQTWRNAPICSQYLVYDKQYQYLLYQQLLNVYLFDGSDLLFYQNSLEMNQGNIQDELLLYNQYNLNINPFQFFCNKQSDRIYDENSCYECLIKQCLVCGLQIDNYICLKCEKEYKLQDGKCISSYVNFNHTSCQPPYYATFKRKCELCQLKNCLYCFEYFKNYDEFGFTIEYEKNIVLPFHTQYKGAGCLLCEKGFNFDFSLGVCLDRVPTIKNCLTSCVSIRNEELCIASSLDNFQVSREITICDSYIPNCQECFLDYLKVVKCISCISGFELQIGQCYQNQEQIPNNQQTFWNLKIQSFLINIVYDAEQDQKIIKLTQCGKNCNSCVLSFGEYKCEECDKKSIDQQIWFQYEMCEQCSQICQVCQIREEREIEKFAPLLSTQYYNTIYTRFCLKPKIDPSIYYDPYYKSVKYCENADCNNELTYEVFQMSCNFERFPRDLDYFRISPEYLNGIGADSITIIIKMEVEDEICILMPTLQSTASLKQVIFTLKTVHFQLISSYPFKMEIYNPFSIEEYDSFTMIGFNLILVNFDTIYFNLKNKINQVDIKFINLTIIDSQIKNVQSLFKADQFGDVELQNISIINTQFTNSSLFNFNQFSLNGVININSIYIYNCTFIDSILFEFSSTKFTIQFQNVTIDLCHLSNSSIFYFRSNSLLQVSLYLITIQIFQTNFYSSQFFFCSQFIGVIALKIIFNNNYLQNSVILGFSSHLESSYIDIKNNTFIESQFISTIQIINQDSILCSIKELLIKNNNFQNSNLFRFFSNFQANDLLVIIQNVLIQFNEGSINTDQLSYLFNINSKKMILQNFVINDNFRTYILYLYDSADIQLLNYTFRNSQIQLKVSSQSNCLSKLNIQNQLLQIVGFDKIMISNFKIFNLQSIDESIIKIMSSSQYYQEQVGQIKLINLEFNGNLLLSLNSIIYFSLVSIISDKNLDIQIENVLFYKNIMHVYNENSLKDSAALIYIATLQSTILIENLHCNQNAMTNSSNSFINIASKNLKINNLLVQNHNVLPIKVWNDYYDLTVVDQEDIKILIMQIFHIKTIGGVAYIQAANFICKNVTIEKIIAAKSSVFDILTSNEGIILISNLNVHQTINNLQEKIDSSGCISVNSQYSSLNFTIIQANFQNIVNRMSSAILTIIPSLISNKLIFQSLTIIDCVSLKNQIVKILFLSQINKQNSISFFDLKIIQNKDAWINLFSDIGELQQNEIIEITGNDNALIYLENCDMTLKNIYIEGMLFSRAIKLNNINNLVMFNCYFQNILSIFTQNLISISLTTQQKCKISLKAVNFFKASMYNAKMEQNQVKQQQKSQYLISGCSIIQSSSQFQPQDYFYNNIIYLTQSLVQPTSILYIQSQSNQTILLFDMVNFENNNYSASQDGIIHFDEINFHRLKILRLNCNFNQIKNYGCLNIISNSNTSQQVQIENSNFIQNIGTQGIAIKGSEVFLKLDQCKIVLNIALSQGGGLYLQLNTKQFFILNTILINNKAQEGGGIYFEDDNDLIKKKFLHTFLNFNTAQIYGNNLVEHPDHLTIYINSKEMSSSYQMKNNISTRVLKIKPQKVIEQGKSIISDMFMIPSTQVINSYQIFILKQAAFINYIKNINIYFLNSKGELLFNLQNSTCQVADLIVKSDNQEIQGSTIYEILQFQATSNNFELGTLAFRLDPYQNEQSHLQIQISCKTQKTQNELKYIINAKSFKCQLGEFYIENGCQMCKSSQGFYSVTYDAIKCSIYDKTKFQSINSNMINLRQGYWRPNHLSDYTEECYKNTEFCLGGWQVGDITCKVGHIGALCEICDIYNIRGHGQFFKNQQNLNCLSCSGDESSIFPFLLALFQVLLSITLTLKSINKSNLLFSSLRIFQKFSKIIFKLNQDHEGILIKILLNYLWIFSSIFSFNIQFSFSIYFIEQSSNSFYFMVNNLDCYLSDIQIHLIYFKVFFILLLMLLQFYFILVLSFLYHKLLKRNMDNSLLSSTLLYLYLFNYGGLIKMLCSSLSVRQISNINYIQGDVSLLFDKEEHYLWIYFLIIPLLFIFGCLLPFSLFLMMFMNRHQLDKIKFRKHICYLFNEYHEKTYYWEQIKLIQKAIIILITTNFENNLLIKTAFLGLCLHIYQILAIKKKPYIISKFNNLDLQSGQICLISIFLAASQYESQVLQNHFFSMCLQIILILLLFRLSYPFILNIATIYYQKYAFFFLKIIHQFLNRQKLYLKYVKKCGLFLDKKIKKKEQLQMNILKIRQLVLNKIETEKKEITSSNIQIVKSFSRRHLFKTVINSKASLVEINNQL
ncbi:unnamed protein product [Paramecium sonneborni]|uniref:Transmembrane protein n=1 Tax=Paramecium sonneborni TaxID=65129 RepID=A0A8S1QM60_9CILI|nr:unnamed protein product [Paramecium sonneborni]